MTTQTNLTLEQLPYGYEAALLSDLFAIPGKILGAIGSFVASLEEAIELRNSYLALNGLSDGALERLGIARATIPQIVAFQAGLFETPVTPVADVADNSNLRAIRPAA